jgi:riboflavin synthase
MFTGIIEALGHIVEYHDHFLRVRPNISPGDWKHGESVSVNGCCLTVTGFQDGLTFDVGPETLARTSLGGLQPDDLVNLERAMPANGRFGGHIVQGHVDTVGKVVGLELQGGFAVLEVDSGQEYDRYLIDKGSITVDGISLTVIKPRQGRFQVQVIPTTLSETNLQKRLVGDRVNLEFDILAKHVEKLLSYR